jgi:hypothetical protein
LRSRGVDKFCVASRRSWRLGSARDEHNWLSLQCFRQADGLELVVISRVPVEKLGCGTHLEKTSRQDALETIFLDRVYISGHPFFVETEFFNRHFRSRQVFLARWVFACGNAFNHLRKRFIPNKAPALDGDFRFRILYGSNQLLESVDV